MVPRKAGWDTHGLPVELEIEKELGINGKEQIEKYGLDDHIKGIRQLYKEKCSLMLSEMDDLTDHQYGTRTRFSGDDSHSYENYNYKWTWHDTPGFWSEHGRINVGRNGLESGVRLRCVRDTE